MIKKSFRDSPTGSTTFSRMRNIGPYVMYDSISDIVVAGRTISAYAASAVSWRSMQTRESRPPRVSVQTEGSGQDVMIEDPWMMSERTGYGLPRSTASGRAMG